MKHSFLLLNAVTPAFFGTTEPEFFEALTEVGCSAMSSQDLDGSIVYFIVGPTLECLEQVVIDMELPGNIIKMSEVYISTLL